jgi:hypothetical protein
LSLDICRSETVRRLTKPRRSAPWCIITCMKRLAGLLTLFSSLALAESWNGTLVDVMCKNQDLAGHTTKCAIGCSKSGYGLVLADGKFVKFDEAGNAKALAALKATTKEKDLKAKVTGTLDGETVQVESVELQ